MPDTPNPDFYTLDDEAGRIFGQDKPLKMKLVGLPNLEHLADFGVSLTFSAQTMPAASFSVGAKVIFDDGPCVLVDLASLPAGTYDLISIYQEVSEGGGNAVRLFAGARGGSLASFTIRGDKGQLPPGYDPYLYLVFGGVA